MLKTPHPSIVLAYLGAVSLLTGVYAPLLSSPLLKPNLFDLYAWLQEPAYRWAAWGLIALATWSALIAAWRRCHLLWITGAWACALWWYSRHLLEQGLALWIQQEREWATESPLSAAIVALIEHAGLGWGAYALLLGGLCITTGGLWCWHARHKAMKE